MMIGAVACDKKEKNNPPTPPEPTEFDYTEPFMQFGANLQTAVTGIVAISGEDAGLYYNDQYLNQFQVDGIGAVHRYVYIFSAAVLNADGSMDSSSTGTLSASAAMFETTNKSGAMEFLQEHYTDTGETLQDGTPVYMNAAQTIIVFPYDIQGGFVLEYQANSQSRAETLRTHGIEVFNTIAK